MTQHLKMDHYRKNYTNDIHFHSYACTEYFYVLRTATRCMSVLRIPSSNFTSEGKITLSNAELLSNVPPILHYIHMLRIMFKTAFSKTNLSKLTLFLIVSRFRAKHSKYGFWVKMIVFMQFPKHSFKHILKLQFVQT